MWISDDEWAKYVQPYSNIPLDKRPNDFNVALSNDKRFKTLLRNETTFCCFVLASAPFGCILPDFFFCARMKTCPMLWGHWIDSWSETKRSNYQDIKNDVMSSLDATKLGLEVINCLLMFCFGSVYPSAIMSVDGLVAIGNGFLKSSN
jgi:hypothetical protein